MASVPKFAIRMSPLRNELLATVGSDAHHPPTGIGRPQRAIPLGQNAFGSLQIPANGAD